MTNLMTGTPFDALNEVLSELVGRARTVLAYNFVGAYLQGSFAIGDFSEFSDCDFMIITRTDLSSSDLAGLQQLHKDIHRLPLPYWPRNLEGSYAPQDILRAWSLDPRDAPGEPRGASWRDPGMDGTPPRCYPFWYLNHGADTLVRSEHDNSQVVRWTLRERGVCLDGPDLKQLIDPVPVDALRAEVRQTMDLAIGTGMMMPTFALQAFWVGLFCRILHTIDCGQITSKKEAMAWAQENLDPSWQGLIAQSLTLRKGDEVQASTPVDGAVADATRVFAFYCRDLADAMMKA